jgi:hypothetical protein
VAAECHQVGAAGIDDRLGAPAVEPASRDHRATEAAVHHRGGDRRLIAGRVVVLYPRRFCALEARPARPPNSGSVCGCGRVPCTCSAGQAKGAEIEAMLGRYIAPVSRSYVTRFHYDQRITARVTLGRVLWVLGLPGQAMREMEDNIAEALSLSHVLTLTHALSDGACPVALLAGDLDAAERFTTLLEVNTGIMYQPPPYRNGRGDATSGPSRHISPVVSVPRFRRPIPERRRLG